MAFALFQHREQIAGVTAALVLALLASAPAPRLAPPNPPQQRMIEVTLDDYIAPPEAPPAPPEAPPQPTTPTVAPIKPTVAPKVKQAPAAIAEVGKTVEAEAATAAQPTPTAPAQPIAAPVAMPQPTREERAVATVKKDLESVGRYIAGVRSHLEQIKRYPTSRQARLEHPVGLVEVWFTLDHSGKLVDLGIEKSSGSPILDEAALSTVRRGEYQSFPPDAWEGEPTHRFTVELNFTLQQ